MPKQLLKKIIARILRWEAELVLLKYKPRIIGVTGNVGKTSTKDAIHAVLATTFFVRKSQKNLNNELGVPLTVLGLESGWGNFFSWVYNIFAGLVMIIFPQKYPEWLVLELGADRPGDIKSLASWLPLDFAVITSIGNLPVHIEFFKTKEALAKEKSRIKDALLPTGVLVLNADDPLVLKMKDERNKNTVTYGFGENSQIRASNDRVVYEAKDGKKLPIGISFKLDVDGKSVPVHVNGIFGTHHIYSSLAACAVGVELKINLLTVIEALSNYEKTPGRLRLIEGERDTLILDDTYNAAPLATEKALESLNNLEVDGKKYAIMGDMLELGEYTVSAHEQIGKMMAGICDGFVTTGQRAKFFAEGAKLAGMDVKKIKSFDTPLEAARYLEPKLRPGDVVLIKGSQGARMEAAVEELMAHPEDAGKLLVRQEKEWKRKI